MLEWLRELSFARMLGITVGWSAMVLVLVLAATALTPLSPPSEPVEGLNSVIVCPPPFTTAERMAGFALSAPLPFVALWLYSRLRRP